jgi:hypothetical protein
VRRVDVMAATAESLVRYAGGWLFDLALDGWDIAVHVTDLTDARPVLILGGHPAVLDGSSRSHARPGCPRIVAIDAELYRAEAWVVRRAQEAAAVLSEVRLWGEERRVTADLATTPVRHRLSVAAQAFKAQAMAAVGAPLRASEPSEMFHRLVPRQLVRSLAASANSFRRPITALR